MLKVVGRAQSFLRKVVIRPFSSQEQKYTKLSHVDHILQRPGMYVGSNKLASSEIWLHDKKLNVMSKQTMNITPALLKIFDEIIVNAADNQQRDKTMSKIEINVNYTKKNKILSISIKNDGLGIPIKMHETEKVFIPELIFGQLMTGSNFDDTVKRVVGGTHGHGAKMTNIFSKKFAIEAYDKTRLVQ
jgi:DNA topoisomerase-2